MHHFSCFKDDMHKFRDIGHHSGSPTIVDSGHMLRSRMCSRRIGEVSDRYPQITVYAMWLAVAVAPVFFTGRQAMIRPGTALIVVSPKCAERKTSRIVSARFV
jgi:hypothetical protein